MRVNINSFRGEAPRLTPRALPANAAQNATNARLLTGDLEAWKQFAVEQALANAGPVLTIYKLNDIWMSWDTDVDVARGAIAGDATFRTFLTGPDEYDRPRWTNYAMATSGAAPYPFDTRPLGVPPPDSAPSVAAGVDPNSTTFSVDVLDEGDQLATNWTKSATYGGPFPQSYSDVSQDATLGYVLTYSNNQGIPAYLYRNFGVANSNATRMSVNIRFPADSTFQGTHVHVMCPVSGAGITIRVRDEFVVGPNGVFTISNSVGWTVNGMSDLAAIGLAALTADTWYTLVVQVVQNSDATQTVTAELNLGSATIASLTATNVFDIGDYCGFAEDTAYDNTTDFRVGHDDILVQANGATGYTPINTATNYAYTYVNDIGEESAPSFASTTVLRPDGVTVTVTTPTDVPTGIDNAEWVIQTKRIYRAVTGATGTFYRFVAEIALATADYVDDVPDTELGEILESELWALPPIDMKGILALPNGVMAAFSGNQLCLSAQNHPHAWPVEYRLTTDTDIVAIGAIDTTVVIATKNFIYLAIGTDPSAYSMTKLEVPQACVAKRSLAYLIGTGVVFSSPDGLIAVAGNGNVRNLTSSVFTRDQWQALVPESIVGVAHDDVYHFFYDNDPVVAGDPWLFFNEGDGSEPINISFGSFVSLTSPIPFVDAISAVSDDGFGSNETFVSSAEFAVPLFSANALPGPAQYSWAPAGGPALEPSIVSGNPDFSTPQWAASNFYVSLGFGVVPVGWLGGVLTLYSGNDATGASGATVITFITGSVDYPPVSIEYVGPA